MCGIEGTFVSEYIAPKRRPLEALPVPFRWRRNLAEAEAAGKKKHHKEAHVDGTSVRLHS